MGLPNAFNPFSFPFFKSPSQDIVDNSGDKSEGPVRNNQQIADLNVEANRLKTFENWHVTFIDKQTLALLGFYYYGPNDLVKCYFCGVEIGMWEEGDDVLTDHVKWSPSCSLIRRNVTNNIPINETLLNQILPPQPTPDVYGAMDRLTETVSEGSIETVSEDDVHMYQHMLFDEGGIEAVLRGNGSIPAFKPSIARPEFPEYAVEAKRIESYADWPKLIRQRPQELSDAGFYYTGKGDRVCCFSCGGGLKDWEEKDDPWEQHAMWYGNCEYLKLIKGEDFIAKMAKKRDTMCKNSNDEIGSCSSQSSSQSSSLRESQSSSTEKLPQESLEKSDEEDDKKDAKLCKICYNNEYDTIFLPCAHVIACGKCASSVSKCPACRQPFAEVRRIYFS